MPSNMIDRVPMLLCPTYKLWWHFHCFIFAPLSDCFFHGYPRLASAPTNVSRAVGLFFSLVEAFVSRTAPPAVMAQWANRNIAGPHGRHYNIRRRIVNGW